jgi:hypothetical protein
VNAFGDPSDDVLKARVTTIGPEEHTIIAESGSQKAKQWTIYDVGGSQGQRGAHHYEIGTLLKPLIFNNCIAAWAQFFDDGTLLLSLKTQLIQLTNTS